MHRASKRSQIAANLIIVFVGVVLVLVTSSRGVLWFLIVAAVAAAYAVIENARAQGCGLARCARMGGQATQFEACLRGKSS